MILQNKEYRKQYNNKDNFIKKNRAKYIILNESDIMKPRQNIRYSEMGPIGKARFRLKLWWRKEKPRAIASIKAERSRRQTKAITKPILDEQKRSRKRLLRWKNKRKAKFKKPLYT